MSFDSADSCGLSCPGKVELKMIFAFLELFHCQPDLTHRVLWVLGLNPGSKESLTALGPRVPNTRRQSLVLCRILNAFGPVLLFLKDVSFLGRRFFSKWCFSTLEFPFLVLVKVLAFICK